MLEETAALGAGEILAGVYGRAAGALVAVVGFGFLLLESVARGSAGKPWAELVGVHAAAVGLATFTLVLGAYWAALRLMRHHAWARACKIAQEVHAEVQPSLSQGKRIATAQRVGDGFGKRKRWLMAMPAPKSNQVDHMILAHLPMHLLKLWWVAFVHWPAWLLCAALRHARTGSWPRPVTDGDLLDAVTKTSLIMLTTNDAERGAAKTMRKLTFKTPVTQCPESHCLRMHDGTVIAGLTIVFDVPCRRVLRATLADEVLVLGTDATNQFLLGCLALAMQALSHPKLHVQSERSAFEIAQTQCRKLEPSSRFVASLHEGLLYSAISPLDHTSPFNSGATSSAVHTFCADIPHRLDANLRIFPVYDFMWQAHAVVARLVAKHELPVNAAALTANAVLHSIDHFGVKQCFSGDRGAIARNPTLADYLRNDAWISFWTSDDICTNPLEPEFVSSIDTPFYRDLYTALCAINPTLAAHAVSSCSF